MAGNFLVGVLISPVRVRRLRENEVSRSLSLLLAASKVIGTALIFFSIDGIDLRKRKIEGWSLHGDTWVRRVSPYPQAIYLRSSYSSRTRKLLADFFLQLERQGTVFINYPLRMDKWEMYKCLAAQPGLRQYVPPTWPIRTLDDIASLLELHHVLYLKACLSGRGKLVMRVEKINTGEYYFTRYDGGLKTGKLHWGALRQEIRAFFDQSKVIAQKEIDLIQVGGCNVDFRAELYRDGSELPKLIGIPVRIGLPGSPITTHSSSMSLEDFCAQYSLVEYKEFRERAEEFLTKTYVALEDCFGESGELGIDFGLDTQGRLWFIEGNSHSAKVSLYNSYSDEVLIKLYQGLLAYAAKHKLSPPK